MGPPESRAESPEASSPVRRSVLRLCDRLSLTVPDPDHTDENRFVTIGKSALGWLLVVVHMKKASEDIRSEYDFSRGVRGKYSLQFRRGANLVLLEPEVAEFFFDSAAVNDALKALIEIAKRGRKPRRRATKVS